jgi:hypothetical protein
MKLIGLNKDGTQNVRANDYISMKKSVPVRKGSKFQKDAKVADSKDFGKYRKENYTETIKLQKEMREKALEKKKEEAERGTKLVASYQKTNAKTTTRRK